MKNVIKRLDDTELGGKRIRIFEVCKKYDNHFAVIGLHKIVLIFIIHG